MTWKRTNRIGLGWIVAAVAVLSFAAAGPTVVYAKSGHGGGHRGGHGSSHGGGHQSGHRSGGHGLHVSFGHRGGSHASYGYSGYGHRGYGYSRYGHSRYGYGGSGYGYRRGYGYGHGSGYGYRNSYYRYPPIRNRYGSSYGYGGYGSSGYPSRSRVRVYYGGSNGVAASPYRVDTRQAPVSSIGGATAYGRGTSADTEAWVMLADGRHRGAMSYFAAQAPARPGDGLPKIGYALSAALGGDLDVGVWAMRRAVGVDVGALHLVRESGEAAAAIDQAIVLYGSGYDTDRPDADKAFMLAVLYDLRGDVSAARAKITEAIDAGDNSTSAAALRQMLDDDYPQAAGNDGGSDDY